MSLRPDAIVQFPSEAFVRQQRLGRLPDVMQRNLQGQNTIKEALQAIHSQLNGARETLAISIPMAIAPRTHELLAFLQRAEENVDRVNQKTIHFGEHIQATLDRHMNGSVPDCILPVDIEDLGRQSNELSSSYTRALESLAPKFKALNDDVLVSAQLSSLFKMIDNSQANLRSGPFNPECYEFYRASDLASPDLLRKQMQLSARLIGQRAEGLSAIRTVCVNLINKHVGDGLTWDELHPTFTECSSQVSQAVELCNREFKFVNALNDPSRLPPTVVDRCLMVCERINSNLTNFDDAIRSVKQRVRELRTQVLNVQADVNSDAGGDQFINGAIQMADSFLPNFRWVRQEVARHLWAIKAEVVDVPSPSEPQHEHLLRLFNQTAKEIDLLNLHFTDNLNPLQRKLDEASSRLGGAAV